MERRADRPVESGRPSMSGVPSSDRSRYSRQTLFAPIGEAGQDRLSASRVAIAGMGALGTVLADHMVRAGVGFVRVIDRDFVEASNLQRQTLYDEADALGLTPKAVAAASRLRSINSTVTVEAVVEDINPTNAEALLSDVDLLLDGTDNFAVRYLLNEISVKYDIPWIYGGAVSSRGISLPIVPGRTPCFRCLYPQVPAPGTSQTCDTAGVIAPIVQTVASFQAAEALKLLTGNGNRLNTKLVHWDLWYNIHSAVDVSRAKRDDCPCCSGRNFEALESAALEDMMQSLCGRNAVQISPVRRTELSLSAMAESFRKLGTVTLSPFLLKFAPNDAITFILFPDGRAIVQGTDDPVFAKNLYSRFVGM